MTSQTIYADMQIDVLRKSTHAEIAETNSSWNDLYIPIADL